MEGASILQVERILSGRKLYAAPSLEYIPMIYTPLYFYVSALLCKLFGSSFFGLRLVSLVSSLGCLFFVYRFVQKEGCGRWAAIVASGFFAATYGLTRGWFDIARVDSMFLFLALCSLYILKNAKSISNLAVAGAVAALAFQTKQSELLIFAMMAVYAAYIHRKQAAYFIGAYVGLVIISAFLLNRSTNGWYYYYVFSLPSKHPIDSTKWMIFWNADLMPALTIAMAASALYLCAGLDWAKNKRSAVFYICTTAGILASSWSGRLHSGGYINVLMPAYVWISVLSGLAIGRWIKRAGMDGDYRSFVGVIFIYGICIYQYIALLYNPFAYIPNSKDYDAGQNLVRTIAKTDGEVFIPFHPYLAVLAGKRSTFHRMAFADIDRSTDKEKIKMLHRELNQVISHRHFDMIILDDLWMRNQVSKKYRLIGPAFKHNSEFWPKSGLPKRPQYIYKLRQARS